MKRSRFLKNAAIVSLGGLIAKGIGALYKIPLAGVLGGYGMGLYQMAYPFFCVLLTFSSAGIPSALARMVAGERAGGGDGRGLASIACKLFFAVGAAGTAVMVLFAPLVSAMQGQEGLTACYFVLAPAVLLVALIAVLRGYFQGRNEMAPTAASEVVEQLFKAAAGLFLAKKFSSDPVLAVCGALGAVTLSEAAALLCLFARFGRGTGARLLVRPKASSVFFSSLPVMASAAILPLSQMADSVVIVRLLSKRTARAVPLYGLLAGGAASLVGLPAAVCYGLVAAIVPAVAESSARGEEEESRRRSMYALLFTILLTAPCATLLFLFAGPIVALLYPALGAGDAETLVSLVKLSSVSAVTLAGVDTLAASLAGSGRAKWAALSMLFAVGVKLGVQLLLVPRYAVGGAAIASNICYLVAFFLDLFYTVRKREEKYDRSRESRSGEGGSDLKGETNTVGGGRGGRSHRRSLGTDAG